MIKLIISVVLIFSCCGMRAPTDAQEANEWYARMRQSVSNLDKNVNLPNRIEKLEDHVFKFGQRYPHPDARWNELYKTVRQMMMREPNHLEYLTQKIETERAKVANHDYHSGTRNSFNNMRVEIIRDTLCHLPSPSTVAVLGKYLSDERDTPPPELPGQDWGDALSNAYQACTALGKIGLRNAPVQPKTGQNESNLATWRLWWGQVEAGTRAFSFEGEDIEYRLRKDGTWETSALGSKSKSAMNPQTSTHETKSLPSSSSRWWYVILGTFLGLTWLRWRKMRRLSKDILK